MSLQGAYFVSLFTLVFSPRILTQNQGEKNASRVHNFLFGLFVWVFCLVGWFFYSSNSLKLVFTFSWSSRKTPWFMNLPTIVMSQFRWKKIELVLSQNSYDTFLYLIPSYIQVRVEFVIICHSQSNFLSDVLIYWFIVVRHDKIQYA